VEWGANGNVEAKNFVYIIFLAGVSVTKPGAGLFLSSVDDIPLLGGCSWLKQISNTVYVLDFISSSLTAIVSDNLAHNIDKQHKYILGSKRRLVDSTFPKKR
jgi:hypothetical protein